MLCYSLVAWGLPWTTASDVFTLPSVVAGMEYPRPTCIMAQELCRHLQRCLKHEDVVRQLTLRDLNLACEQWACGSVHELRKEMELWKWDLTLSNRWARVAKCMQLLNIPIELAEDANEDKEQRGTSWASATRELRRLRCVCLLLQDLVQRCLHGGGIGSKRLEEVKTSGRLGFGIWIMMLRVFIANAKGTFVGMSESLEASSRR
jgi:hypothetical protein